MEEKELTKQINSEDSITRDYRLSEEALQRIHEEQLNISPELKARITPKLIELHKIYLEKELIVERDYDMYRSYARHQKASGIERTSRRAFRKYDDELKKCGFDFKSGNQKMQGEWQKVTLYMNTKYPLEENNE